MCECVHRGSIQGVECDTLVILKRFREGDELGNITKNRGNTSIIVMYIEHYTSTSPFNVSNALSVLAHRLDPKILVGQGANKKTK